MENSDQSHTRDLKESGRGERTKPYIYFYELEDELEAADASGAFGYLRSSFEIINIRLSRNKSVEMDKVETKHSFSSINLEQACLETIDSWIVVSESSYLRMDQELTHLLEKAGFQSAINSIKPEMNRLLIYSPQTQNGSDFLPPRINHWELLFPKIILLSAVQKTPSIWNKSLIFFRYHCERLENNRIFQDAYPIYFSPALRTNSYFKMTTKDGNPLLSENISYISLTRLSELYQDPKNQTQRMKLTWATSSSVMPARGPSIIVDSCPRSEKPPMILFPPFPATFTENSSQTIQNASQIEHSSTHQLPVWLNEPVPALFDSFILCERVFTNIREVHWGKTTSLTADLSQTNEPPQKVDSGDTELSHTQETGKCDRPQPDSRTLHSIKSSRLSSGFLWNMSNLRKKGLAKVMPTTPAERDEVILDFVQQVRRKNAVDHSHGFRVLYVLDKEEFSQEVVRPRITVIGVAGLFSKTWGGLSPSDLASLHVPLIETIQALTPKNQRLLTSLTK